MPGSSKLPDNRSLSRFLLVAAALLPSISLPGDARSPDPDAGRDLLREMIRRPGPRVKQIRDDYGRLIRVELSRHGGRNPDEIVTFPAAGITLRERDEDGDGFFEERRIEHESRDVSVDRRTKDDPSWRPFELRSIDRAANLVRVSHYDASGEKVVSESTEPLWSEAGSAESYADRYLACLEARSTDSESCTTAIDSLGNDLPLPYGFPGEVTSDQYDLMDALTAMRGIDCTTDQYLYTGTGFRVDRRSCGDDPQLMHPLASAAEQGVAGLMQCFSPMASGRAGSMNGVIHYPSFEMADALAETFFEHVQMYGGITLECAEPTPANGMMTTAVADASSELHRIRFRTSYLKGPALWTERTLTGGHEFLHLTKVLGEQLDVDNQSVADHNAPSQPGAAPIGDRDRVYGCAALCLGTRVPSKQSCELCLDRDLEAARSLCGSLPTSDDLNTLRIRLPEELHSAILAACHSPETAGFTSDSFQSWRACIDSARARLDSKIDGDYGRRSVADPRWPKELYGAHATLEARAVEEVLAPVCSTLKALGPEIHSCVLSEHNDSCADRLRDKRPDPSAAVMIGRVQSVVDSLSIVPKVRLKKTCKPAAP